MPWMMMQAVLAATARCDASKRRSKSLRHRGGPHHRLGDAPKGRGQSNLNGPMVYPGSAKPLRLSEKLGVTYPWVTEIHCKY